MQGGSVVQQVVQTVLASQHVTATPQQRTAAVQLFEQLKAGELHASAGVGVELIKAQQPLEVQVLGYGLLQHLVGNRWDEFTQQEQSQMATLAYTMLQEVGGQGSWAARSKASSLLAMVIKRSGADLWDAALLQLIAAAEAGPAMQAAVSMVMRYVADEVMQYADDIQGETKRLLLASLTKSLAQVLPFLEQTLERNFAAAAAASQAGQQDAAQQHIAALQAALAAVGTYAEWAPLNWLKQAGLINACGFLLGTLEFRDAACDTLRTIAGRKQSADEAQEVFAAVTAQLADALSTTAAALLAPAVAKELDYDGANDEFGLKICEAMATMAPHFGSVTDPARRLAFLEQMLAFAQHAYLLLADKALPFWVKLLQDVASASNANAKGASPTSPKNAAGTATVLAPAQQPQLPPEAVIALMEMAAEQLQKRGAHTPQEQEEVPPYFDTFPEYKDFMVTYRAKLSLVVRSAAALLPEQALLAAGRRLEAAAAACASPGQLDEARVVLESAVYFMDSTFKAVWDESVTQQPAKLQAIVSVTEPMLQRVLGLRASDAIMLLHQARGLESFGKLMAARPDLLPPAVGRVLELLVGVVPLESPGQQPPPGKPPPGWREGLQARQSVAMVLLAWAKEGPASFLPHLEGLATRVKELWDAGSIRAGEKNVISEAILGASVAGPQQLQLSVAEWVLSPVRLEWAHPAFQATLSSPQAFIAHYLPIEADPSGGYQVGGQLPRWQLYHQVHLLERAVRRLAGAQGAAGHPFAPHAEWALPLMLRIITCLHAVFTPEGRQMLAPVAAVLEMSVAEKALYLKKGGPGRSSKISDDDSDGDYSSVGGTTTGSIRAWLRHLREFLYQTLGLLPTHCPAALDCAAAQSVFARALGSYVESLPSPQLRIVMRHITLPYIRSCPQRHIATWLVPHLAMLAPHMHARLTGAWAALQQQQQVVAGPSQEDSASANDEIIRDRVVRELTQEYAVLLQDLSSRRLDDEGAAAGAAAAGAGAGAQASAAALTGGLAGGGGGGKGLLELLMELDANTGFVMLTTAVAGMCWQDESAFRFGLFCHKMVGLAPRDQRLYAYVGTEVLRAAITSLASEHLSTHQGDMLSLIRAILVQQLSDANSAVAQVLLSLPSMTSEKLEAFKATLFATASEKGQRDGIKRFLVTACGKASFAGLADWRPPSTVALSEPKLRAPMSPAKADQPDVFFNQIFG